MINDKYKERKPEETVQIIKKWFEDRGLKCIYITSSTSYGTYFTILHMFLGKHKLANTYGKGVTKEFSEASAFGEMLEVYFGFFGYNSSVFSQRKLIDCFPNYVDKNMKWLSAKEIVEDKYINHIFSNDEIDAEDLVNRKYGNSLLCDEYTNIIDNSKKWLSSKVLIDLQGTNGISGGNTWQEAFNQAMSELCERNTVKDFTNGKMKKFCWIKNENIKEPYLQNLIKNIENDQKDLYIIDCSYETKQPVVMTAFVDKVANRFYVQFGSFPVFEIALERCLTEASQGAPISYEKYPNMVQLPFKSQDINDIWSRAFKNISILYCQNEIMLNNLTEVEGPSTVYVDKNLNNDQILNYWKEFIKNNKLEVYYKNFSPVKDFASVKVWAGEFGEIQFSHTFYNDYIKINKEQEKNDAVKNFRNLNDLISKTYDKEEFIKNFKILRQKLNFKNYELDLIDHYPAIDSFFNNGTYILDYINLMFNTVNNLNLKLESTYPFCNYFYFKKYLILRDYIKAQYTKEEIINIGKTLHYDWTEEDLNNINNESYLIENVFYKPLWNFYHSEEYKNLIGSLIGEL